LGLDPRPGLSSELTISAGPGSFYALAPLIVATALTLPLGEGRGGRQHEADRQRADSDREPFHWICLKSNEWQICCHGPQQDSLSFS
jgi:hypothetical protein